MKISDAKPGDVLRDRSGSLWLIEPTPWTIERVCAVRVGLVRPEEIGGGVFAADQVRTVIGRAEEFGPFVRLIPEKEPTDAA